MPISLHAQQAELEQLDAVEESSQNQNSSELASDIEALQQALIDLNRDLKVLEEDLLFPSSSQMAIYLSMDVDKFFALDSIEIKIDEKNHQPLFVYRETN
jgi:KaiC/GvpD/RAD55 family RecA-like ATPase